MKAATLLKLLPARSRARFAEHDPERFLAELEAFLGDKYPGDYTALEIPGYYDMDPGELLSWLEVVQADDFMKPPFDTHVLNALSVYRKENIPMAYVRTIREKRNPIRGAAQIAGCFRYGITAEYAIEANWSYKTDIIWQFQNRGIPASWTQILAHMSNQPEWVEIYWTCGMSLDYALALWKTNVQPGGAQCGHHKIVECWENEVPLEYATVTAPWLAGEDVVRGWKDGIDPEYLLAMLKPT
jgi:hypothetical protein